MLKTTEFNHLDASITVQNQELRISDCQLREDPQNNKLKGAIQAFTWYQKLNTTEFTIPITLKNDDGWIISGVFHATLTLSSQKPRHDHYYYDGQIESTGPYAITWKESNVNLHNENLP